MEFCRRWGVAAAVRTAVWPESHPRDFVYLDNLRGRELMRVKMPSYMKREQRDFTPEAPCPCPQIYFDPILLQRVKSFPNIDVRTQVRLDWFRQDDCRRRRRPHGSRDRRHAGRQRTLSGRLRWAGREAARSAAIELDGLGVVANSVNIFFRSPELETYSRQGMGPLLPDDRRVRLLVGADPDRRQGIVAADGIR